ncbi:hypothetical protein M8C21_018972 [Ambrosia artemisiifolia]|uniref:Uncharacterized protein n=1 Tax=Ambrosia artemisiifolia TaxID=4212 RepID=A0AAD5C3D2_AMBAR|nr:hypothetical protein M8C21_018972 [Ambrosia artemisiifolia]
MTGMHFLTRISSRLKEKLGECSPAGKRGRSSFPQPTNTPTIQICMPVIPQNQRAKGEHQHGVIEYCGMGRESIRSLIRVGSHGSLTTGLI